jgi:hypothetical protein
MRHLASIMAPACAVILLLPLPAPGADKKDKKLDLVWSHPEIASIPLRSVALLPAVTYDGDYRAEKEIEQAWGPTARATGHRWYYSTMSKDLLRRAFGGDSVLAALRKTVLKDARIDSLSARALCTALRTSAVLTMRADQWSQVEMEFNQTGKPSTTVQIRAALVDSLGRLLWSASGSETAEGPMHQADSGTLGVKSSGLGTQQVTGQGGAPTWQEALTPLFARWTTSFPTKPAPAAAPAPGGGF